MSKPWGSGTPKIALGPVTNFTFRIGKAELERFDVIAKGLGTNKGEILRDLLLTYLEEHEL